MDPYQRAPRSPRGKRPQPLDGSTTGPIFTDECKSPTSDQVIAFFYVFLSNFIIYSCSILNGLNYLKIIMKVNSKFPLKVCNDF